MEMFTMFSGVVVALVVFVILFLILAWDISRENKAMMDKVQENEKYYSDRLKGLTISQESVKVQTEANKAAFDEHNKIIVDLVEKISGVGERYERIERKVDAAEQLAHAAQVSAAKANDVKQIKLTGQLSIVPRKKTEAKNANRGSSRSSRAANTVRRGKGTDKERAARVRGKAQRKVRGSP